MNQITIKDDTFDIANRLKEIDAHYILKWNQLKKRYELYYKTDKKERLELVIPFKELDARTIYYVNQTRVENHKALLKEMEEKNKKLDEQKQKTRLDEAQIQIKELANYIIHKGEHNSLKNQKINQTKWV